MVQKLVCYCLLVVVVSGATWQGKLPPKPVEFLTPIDYEVDDIQPQHNNADYYLVKKVLTDKFSGTPSVPQIADDFKRTWRKIKNKQNLENKHLRGCYVEEIAGVIQFGEEISPIGNCYSIECSRHRLYYSSCGTVNTEDPKCSITDIDLLKPYPQCCPQVKCINENKI